MRQGPPSIVSLLLSDSRLARLAAKGDEQAVEAIFRRHQQDLYRFCLAMTGDPQEAQATMQSTLARVRRALPDKDRRTKLKPWLYRIARDEVYAVCPEPQHRAEAEAAELGAQVRHLLTDLERLPPNQRAVLVMRELSGLDFAQIGSAFETSPGAARETLYEARLRLRQVERSRETNCAETMRRLSDSDGRMPWRLGVKLHLRGCPDCRAFRAEITGRRGDLAVLAPLPIALGAEALRGALGAQVGAGSAATGGAGVSAAIGAGQAAGGSALVKLTATAAAVAVAGLSAADPVEPVEPERQAGAAGPRGAPIEAASAPNPVLPTGAPDPVRAAAARVTAAETHAVAIGEQLVPRSAATADPVPGAAPHQPHATPGPAGEETGQPGVTAHTPSPLPHSTPETIATEPAGADEEASPAVPLAGVEPEAEPPDLAHAALEPPAEALGEPSADRAAPLPAPPGLEAEPPGRRSDRSRHHDRPWRKHR